MGNSRAEEENETMKGLVTVCSECGTKTELREITIEFERKGIHAAMSGIPAMVCPHCGEQYVPGEIAGDVIDSVSSAIDQLGALLRRAKARRRELLPKMMVQSSARLELALA